MELEVYQDEPRNRSRYVATAEKPQNTDVTTTDEPRNKYVTAAKEPRNTFTTTTDESRNKYVTAAKEPRTIFTTTAEEPRNKYVKYNTTERSRNKYVTASEKRLDRYVTATEDSRNRHDQCSTSKEPRNNYDIATEEPRDRYYTTADELRNKYVTAAEEPRNTFSCISTAAGLDFVRPSEACKVMLWDHFRESPWLLHENFEKGYRPGRNYPEVIDLTMGLENEWATMFDVYSVDGFMRISRDLQARCLLFRTYIEHDRVCRISDKSYSTESWTDELAVLINTGHPKICNRLKSVFNDTETDITQGTKICLRLDFGDGLKKWYGHVCERSRSFRYPKSYETNKVNNISVFILNCSRPVKLFMSPWFIGCCFPCWLLTGGCCYYIHRKRTVIDITEKFNYRVTFEGRGAYEREDTPACGCGKIYHLPVDDIQARATGKTFNVV